MRLRGAPSCQLAQMSFGSAVLQRPIDLFDFQFEPSQHHTLELSRHPVELVRPLQAMRARFPRWGDPQMATRPQG